MTIGYCKTITFIVQGEDDIHVFGIDLVGWKDGTYTVLDSAPALTRDWRKICRYVDMMNRLELSPDHFREVAQDIRYDNQRT